MTTDYQPWYTGDTYPGLQIPLLVGGVADNITGLSAANIGVVLRNSATGVDTPGVGTITIVTANPAVITYKFAPADVATAFVGSIVVHAFFPPSYGAADEAVYDPLPFTLTAA